MKKFDKITKHPDKNEIYSKLINGIDPKDISASLKIKYPEENQAHLRLPATLLQDFIKSGGLNYLETFKEDVLAANENLEDEGLDKKTIKNIKKNSAYQEKLNQIADQKIEEINIKKRIIEMEELIRSRFESIFDRLYENPNNGTNNGDYALIKYAEQWLKLLEFYNKAVNLAPDVTIQHNHTIEYVDKRIDIIQTVVKELLFEIDPNLEMIFFQKLQERLLEAKLIEEPVISLTSENVKILEEKLDIDEQSE